MENSTLLLSCLAIFLIIFNLWKKKEGKKFHFQEFLKIFHFEINFKLLVQLKEEESLITIDKLISFRKRYIPCPSIEA